MFIFALGSGSARQLEEVPQVFPLFLGFLVALFVLNLALSFFRKKAARDKKKESHAPEKK